LMHAVLEVEGTSPTERALDAIDPLRLTTYGLNATA
jgi:hypothetical protein